MSLHRREGGRNPHPLAGRGRRLRRHRGRARHTAKYPWQVEKVLFQLRPAIFLLPSWLHPQPLELLQQTKPSHSLALVLERIEGGARTRSKLKGRKRVVVLEFFVNDTFTVNNRKESQPGGPKGKQWRSSSSGTCSEL